MHNSSEASTRRFPQKCPFCPRDSKRMFDEIGLFQHAIAISKCNPNPEVVRAHCSILNDVRKALNSSLVQPTTYMDSEWKKRISISQEAYNVMDHSARDIQELNQNSDVKVVWPWMGIVVNIDYEQLAGNAKTNGKDNNGYANLVNSLWKLDLKGHFSCFNPRDVHAFWNQRLAVLDFGHDLLGSFDVEDFAKGFAQTARGKSDFQSMEKDRVQGLFGWIADENDYKLSDALGEFLRRKGTLRVRPPFSFTWSEQHDQLFKDMRLKLQERNLKLVELKREVCNLQTLVREAENEKYSAKSQAALKELKHKQELETIHKTTKRALQKSDNEVLKQKEKLISLQDELGNLKTKCQLFEENSSKITSDETLLRQLIDVVEEKEGFEFIVQKLTYKEREANDKVQNAMKAAVEVLQIREDVQIKDDEKSIEDKKRVIGVKRMGTLNEAPWQKACAVLFKDEKDGWEFPCKRLISKWDKLLRDPLWYPYKLVTNKDEEEVDAKDEKLAKLKQEFGAEVYKTVVDALNELLEFNPSGRFPVPVPWNFEVGRVAELNEIIRYLASSSLFKKETSLLI